MSRKVETYTEVIEQTRDATVTVCDRCGAKHAHPVNKHGWYGDVDGWGSLDRALKSGGCYERAPDSHMDLCPACVGDVWARIRADADVA